MYRRQFLALSGSAISLAGCSLPEREIVRTREACTPTHTLDSRFRVDVHCHLMTMRDGNASEFLRRRNIGFSEDIYVGNGTLRSIFGLFNEPIEDEIQTLQSLIDARDEITAFCDTTSRRQMAPLPFRYAGPSEHQQTGFVRNRLRNAALLIATSPQADLFIPSMVDMFEIKDVVDWYDPILQRDFYRDLHLATKGLMVPFVSFNPERAVKKPQSYSLDFVREAITTQGFIGVKLHPSVGFDPLDNAAYGCANTGLPDRWENDRLGSEEGDAIQAQLNQLFDLCEELDVPILTHSGGGILANETCQRPDGSEPDFWTNAPNHWLAVLDAHPDLRVCLAHMAGGMIDRGKWWTGPQPVPDPWFANLAKELKRREVLGQTVPLWLDLSAQAEMFGSNFGQRYIDAFLREMGKNNALWNRTMYGSDWHMRSGLAQGYMAKMESIIPENYRPDVMGRTAVQFLGLDRSATQDRLATFYAQNGLDLAGIHWFRKLRHKRII